MIGGIGMSDDIFFRGYIRTPDKKSIDKFKDIPSDQLMTLAQASKRKDYAGILANDVILVDVDDEEQSSILYEIIESEDVVCRIEKTTRGMHFYFINDGVLSGGNSKTLACGLVADIKVGAKNSYSVLKYDGVRREIIYDKLENEEYDKIPCWLKPIQSKIDLYNLGDGDGRNNALFNYILTLGAYDFTKAQTRKTLNIINTYVFEKPLSKNELDTIMRDESFKKQSFFRGKVFLFDKFANFLRQEYNIRRINGQLHLYEDGVYIHGDRNIESKMLKHIHNLNQSKRKEVLAYLEVKCKNNIKSSPANFIAFKNGIYDLETNDLIDFDPEIIITNKINWDYNPKAKSSIIDKTLDKLSCNDKNIRMLLEETIGYTFYRRSELRKSIILVGDKHNGKSTFLDMFLTILGEDNTASLDLAELGNRFKTAELFNKLANIGDDIEDEFVPKPGMFKKLASGDRVNAEKKGKDPFNFNNFAKLMFSANDIPRIKDKTGAVLDRLVIVPFNANITPDDKDFDPYIKYKLREKSAIEYLILLGLEGLKRVLDQKHFTESEQVQKQLEEYAKNNNPVMLFFDKKDRDYFLHEPTLAIYEEYKRFCFDRGYVKLAHNEFSKRAKKHFDLEIKTRRVKDKKGNSNRVQVFV